MRAISTLQYKKVRGGDRDQNPACCSTPGKKGGGERGSSLTGQLQQSPRQPHHPHQEKLHPSKPPGPPQPQGFGAILGDAASRAAAGVAAASAKLGGAASASSSGPSRRQSEIALQDEGYIYWRLVEPVREEEGRAKGAGGGVDVRAGVVRVCVGDLASKLTCLLCSATRIRIHPQAAAAASSPRAAPSSPRRARCASTTPPSWRS
jgi:hypothetical protein